jgi:hypothetical protein
MFDTISFSKMLSEMDFVDRNGNPAPFSIVFVTADRKLNTGGDIHIIGHRTALTDLLRRRIKEAIFTESKAIKVVGLHNGAVIVNAPRVPSSAEARNPHHYKNSTVNVMILSSRAIRKVHPRLILYFNDQKVLP